MTEAASGRAHSLVNEIPISLLRLLRSSQMGASWETETKPEALASIQNSEYSRGAKSSTGQACCSF